MKFLITVALLMPVLTGCSFGWLFDASAQTKPPDSFETIQQYYRPLATNAVRAMVGTPNAPIEISDLKISVAPQPGDWTACVRTSKDGKVGYFSVFFRDRTVFDIRRSIIIDRCEQEQYWILGPQ